MPDERPLQGRVTWQDSSLAGVQARKRSKKTRRGKPERQDSSLAGVLTRKEKAGTRVFIHNSGTSFYFCCRYIICLPKCKMEKKNGYWKAIILSVPAKAGQE